MVDPEVLDDLRARRREKSLIPFVGAGMSMPFDLPSWSELINLLADELKYDREVFRLCGDFRQLAEYYVAERGIGSLRSKLDRMFDVEDARVAESEAHAALVRLGAPLVYTTNYDSVIERAFRLHDVKCHAVAGINDLVHAPPNVTQVVKFHGTFEDDASLVLTESSYFERLNFESALDIKLRADMMSNCLLFIGYSLRDINIRYMLHKLYRLRRQHERHGAGQMPGSYMVTFGANEVQRALLDNWGVTVLELDPMNKTRSTAEFLEELRKEPR